MATTRLETILTALQTALKTINGAGSFNYNLQNRVLFLTVTKSGDQISVNTVRERPSAEILIDSIGDITHETCGECEVPFVLRIDFLLSGTISETNIAKAWADVRRAVYAAPELSTGVHNLQLSMVRFDQGGEFQIIDGARFLLSGAYSESFGDPDNG